MSEENNVSFAILYDNGQGSKMTEALVGRVANESQCCSIDWGYFAGRAVLSVAKEDSCRITRIANLFLNEGYRLYVNDGSGVTVNPGEEWSNETIEEKIIEGYSFFSKRQDTEVWHKLCNSVLKEEEYWKTPRGKQFFRELIASEYRDITQCTALERYRG